MINPYLKSFKCICFSLFFVCPDFHLKTMPFVYVDYQSDSINIYIYIDHLAVLNTPIFQAIFFDLFYTHICSSSLRFSSTELSPEKEKKKKKQNCPLRRKEKLHQYQYLHTHTDTHPHTYTYTHIYSMYMNHRRSFLRIINTRSDYLVENEHVILADWMVYN